MDTAFVAIDTTAVDNHDWKGRNGYIDSQDLKSRNVNSAKNIESNAEPFEILDLEIDRGCNPSSCWDNPQDFLLGSQPNGIQLYRYHEIPSFLQGNPFILKGYRAMLPFSLCYQR